MDQTPSHLSQPDSDYRSLGKPIDEDNVGERVDAYLAKHFPFFSRSSWQKRLKEGRLLVGGRKTRPNDRLRIGDVVLFYHPEEIEPEVDGKVEVIYQEGAVMAAYKPPVLPMHEGGPFRKNTFARFIKEVAGDEWSAVHRLDVETSGIVVCGGTPEVRHELSRMWRAGEVRKEYLAICNDVAEKDEWTCDGPIDDLKESVIRIKRWVVEGGQEALTDFRVEARGPGHTLLRAFPKTGRTNQIRVHAAYSGHLLVGDKLYHPNEDVFLTYFEQGRVDWVSEQTGFKRCCLHAAAITFEHPETSETVRIESPMPADMGSLWRELALTAK